MGTLQQHSAAELKSALETLFRIRAVESPPDEQGARTIWHRGARGADLVTCVDHEGRVTRQELFLFESYFVFDRAGGLRTGVAIEAGTADARDIAFDQDMVLRKKRLEHAARVLAPYAGKDQLIGHVKQVVGRAAQGKPLETDAPVLREAGPVKLDDVRAASQELLRVELEARLAGQKRNLYLFIGAVLIAASAVAAWLAT